MSATPHMLLDVPGRIRNVRVQHALQPLFEAAVNAIHASQDRLGPAVASKGRVVIKVIRVRQPDLPGTPGRAPVAPVLGFTVTDNGAGFNDQNLEAFTTADTTAKLSRGGKGVGRFSWLVVFGRASVTSTFATSTGTWRRRSFLFKPSQNAIEEYADVQLPDGERWEHTTTVELRSPHDRYSEGLRKSGDTIAERLFEHCFDYFVMDSCPMVELVDDDGKDSFTIDINSKLSQVTLTEPLPMQVGPHALVVRHVQKPSASGGRHEGHLCAHQRAVVTISLSDISELGNEPLHRKDGEAVFHHAFVSGPALDEAVDASRTRLDLADGEPLLEQSGRLDLKTLKQELGKQIDVGLADMIKAEREQNFRQIEQHIRSVQPEYRHLLKHAPDDLRKLKYTASRTSMDESLYRVAQNWDAQVRRRQAQVENELSSEGADPDKLSAELASVIAEINETGQANLVRYVAKRRAVLNLLSRLTSRFQGRTLEEHVHQIVFPLRKTLDDLRYEDHNLWLVDDALAFYEHVASDVSFSRNSAAPVDSARRPDILAFKTGDPFQHVALVEFKRPDRDDENPVTQLVEYAVMLRDGGGVDIDGRTLPGISQSVRIDGYAIATLSPGLEKLLRTGPGNMQRVDGEWRWWGSVPGENLTIEVLDYRAFLRRAEQRNHAFFVKLGLG